MADIQIWWLYIPGIIIAAAAVTIFRWLTVLQRRVGDHAERIANLEGRADAGRTAHHG